MRLSQPNEMSRCGILRRLQSVIVSLCRLAVWIGVATFLPSCATKTDPVQAELYPEEQQPYFKTCLAKHDGTYHERELQQHRFIDIYKEPAPDQGPITDDCVVRE